MPASLETSALPSSPAAMLRDASANSTANVESVDGVIEENVDPPSEVR